VNSHTHSPLEIYKILPKTNCGQCLLPSCLAFAVAVFSGCKNLQECSVLELERINGFSVGGKRSAAMEVDQAEFMDKLKAKMTTVDFSQVAPLIGGTMIGNRLKINSLGKDFIVDTEGNVSSECHIIPWVQAPLLAYVCNETHVDVTGRWISFREINGGIEWQGLFSSRCETPLRKLADENQGLLGDLIDLFMGETIDWYRADIALILHPLPKVPILICYQAPEDDLDSVLTIFFDECCPQNLHIKSIFTMCSGLVQMFSKISQYHL
jgi:hypothetical protein